MATKTIWTCDGCDREIEMMGDKTDWKTIVITTFGFGGWPVGEYANGRREFQLCPSCQQELVIKSNPIRWKRQKDEAAS